MHTIDIAVQTYLSGIHTPFLTKFFLIITNIFEILPLIFLVLLVSVIIYNRKGLKSWLLFVWAFGVGEIFVLFFKEFFSIERPLYGIISETSKSFPSGHTTAVTVVFVTLTYILSKDFNKFYKIIFSIFTVLMIGLVSLSRLYLGVHWFSDVFGGVVLGLIVVYLSVRLSNKYNHLPKKRLN